MIARLRGAVLEMDGQSTVVEAGGVGYQIELPASVAFRLPGIGHGVDLYIRQIFREDGVSLYGFLDPFQRRIFDLLMSVKGCGPRVASSLLGQVGEDEVMRCVLAPDARGLTRATGVGARLAERIVLELKDKMAEEALARKIHASTPSLQPPNPLEDELLEALIALGYKRSEAELASQEAGSEGTLEERIRKALQVMRR